MSFGGAREGDLQSAVDWSLEIHGWLVVGGCTGFDFIDFEMEVGGFNLVLNVHLYVWRVASPGVV